MSRQNSDLEKAVSRFQITVSKPFAIKVNYLLPSIETLRSWFTGYVDPSFENATFTAIPACANILRTAGKKAFVLVHLKANASTEEILAELDRLGLRPAFASELYAYSYANPTAGMEFPVVALGDTTLVSRTRCVAVLGRGTNWRVLDLCYIVPRGWRGNDRFLAGPKEVLAA